MFTRSYSRRFLLHCYKPMTFLFGIGFGDRYYQYSSFLDMEISHAGRTSNYLGDTATSATKQSLIARLYIPLAVTIGSLVAILTTH